MRVQKHLFGLGSVAVGMEAVLMGMRRLSWVVVGILSLVIGSMPVAFAQEISAAIQGVAVGPDGQAVAGASVTILHEPSNSAKELSTGPSGRFSARGLRVGGPYKITVKSGRHQTHVRESIFLELSKPLRLNVTLETGNVEEVIVQAAPLAVSQVAAGPSTVFNLSDLESAPAGDRDIKDVIRIDPRIHIDVSSGSAVQCAGGNPRFNSLTVDGVKLNDNFGLNRNGYPTERLPFSFDAISQVAVELAPFDVQYGGFSACNINAVTKAGGNEFHGSVFVDHSSDSFTGDSLDGGKIDTGDFDEDRAGFTISGPIIKDKLFFFAAYEELDADQIVSTGPIGSGAGVEVPGVTQADADRVAQIARDVYRYDPGASFPGAFPVEDEKLLIKLDWNISDDHRAAFTYNYNDGFTVQEADSLNNRLEFEDHYYERGAELKAYIGTVFSDWTENLSTEIKLGFADLDNRQISIGGTDLDGDGGVFGEAQIRLAGGSRIYLGSDDSRHANQLSYETQNFKFAATYALDDHTILAGLEREEFDVFNLFIQEAEGEFRFGPAGALSAIDSFEARTPFRVIYENAAGSNNPQDAAAEFSYSINTAYLQDTFSIVDDTLELVFGLRYDWYTSSDEPPHNQAFADAFGFSNSQNLDGEDLLQPRLGFNWYVNENVEFHGGTGLYSGGNPNVWLSNSYSANGTTQLEQQDRSGADLSTTTTGRPIFDIPDNLVTGVAGGTAGGFVSATDPDFEIPSELKFALGASVIVGDDYRLSIDLLHSERRDSAIIVNPAYRQSGTAFDGRALYDPIETATPDDPPGTTVSFPRTADLLLTNVSGDSGSSTTLSIGVSKSWDFGLELGAGYAYNEAEEVNPMRSSVHFSNYSQVAAADRNSPRLATSNYEIPHSFTLKLGYEKTFIAGLKTKFTLFATTSEGRPYSYTMQAANDSLTGIFNDTGSDLLYVPTGPSDPNVDFAADFATDAFFNWADSEDLSRGSIVKRNSQNADWYYTVDLRIDQELGSIGKSTASAFVIIQNLPNLLDDEWGIQQELSSPYEVVADVNYDRATNRYEFQQFRDLAGETDVVTESLWQIHFGLSVRF